MAIHVQCAGCGAKFQAPEKLAGKRVKCPKCSAAIVVGERPQQPSGQGTPASEGAPPMVVACCCGKKLRARAELAGKRVKCPACGQPLAVPALQPGAAQPADDVELEQLAGEPVIYSVGKDGEDDRALADWRYGQQPGDFVFRLQAPH